MEGNFQARFFRRKSIGFNKLYRPKLVRLRRVFLRYINIVGGLVDFFWRARRGARALVARARMYVTSCVPVFPNQQYGQTWRLTGDAGAAALA
jgi:hypothetical protein